MRPNASGTTRANTSLTIGSLNDRKIFVTRSSAGSITCGTIRKRSKAYFVLFFNSHVELLIRVYIISSACTDWTSNVENYRPNCLILGRLRANQGANRVWPVILYSPRTTRLNRSSELAP